MFWRIPTYEMFALSAHQIAAERVYLVKERVPLERDRLHFSSLLPLAVIATAFLQTPAVVAQVNPPPPPAVAFESIVHQPAQESSFTLDRSMLALADGFFNGQDANGRRIAAGLNNITVRNYHYRDFASYDPGAFAALNASFESAGYRHLVNANGRDAANLTDLWLRFQGAMVTNVVVLTRGVRNMNEIAVDCTLRPLDLLHLGGHFGIPRMDESAVMVPSAPGAPPPAAGNTPSHSPSPMQNPPTLKRHSSDDAQ